MESKEVVAKNLQNFRKREDVSQEKVAFDSEVSQKTYSRVERAKVHTSLKVLDKISKGTGLSVIELLTESDEELEK